MTGTRGPLNGERAFIRYSTDRGNTFREASAASPAGDRPDFPAIAISPDGKDLYLVYDNFLRPWQATTAAPRLMQGVVRHADIGVGGIPGAWADLYRGPTGDARGSSTNSLVAEFLGDYNYAVATREYGAAVWNDVRNAADCPAIDTYRQAYADAVRNGAATAVDEEIEERDAEPTALPSRPAPNTQCPAAFGNTDIFGGSYADPTP